MKDILKLLLQEEKDLQFTSFNDVDAWEIGSRLVSMSRSKELPITIDITRGEQQVFHFSLKGTSADNDTWIKRKARLVNRFGHSSYYIGQVLKNLEKNIEEVFLIKESRYAPHGGSFPIIIKNTGVVGTITVSGLAQEEDHRIVVQAIRNYLGKEK